MVLDSEFTSYHMKCVNRFRWTCLSRSIICKDALNKYFIKPSPFLCQLVFSVYFINTLIKLTFLAFLVTGNLGEIEFLDTICGIDYLLCGLMILFAYIIWQRYPLFEIIYRLWELENRIYRSLGSPREIKWEAEERHSVTWWAHALLTCLGCSSLTIQFYMAPKYCVFTYSLIELDNQYAQVLFCVHEALFLSHAWFAMACSNGQLSFEAVNLSKIIKQMGITVNELGTRSRNKAWKGFPEQATDRDGNISRIENAKRWYGDDGEGKGNSSHFQYDEGAMTEDLKEDDTSPYRRIHVTFSSKRKSQRGRTTERYPFHKILSDYQQLMLLSERFNEWFGYKIVALSICGFCQYISSTTMAFQVLRMPGTGIGDIWFYIQDCTVAVYVTFRVFDYMSVVLPASEYFLQSIRNYQSTTNVGSYLRKFIKTLRPVSLKLGPNPTRRETVLNTMEMLASYYVCVALW